MNIKHIFFTICLAFSNMLIATTALAQCLPEQDDCVGVGKWQFSIALGLGELSNPLHGGDDIPLIVLPYIHYYGEQFFIENNVLGYSFYQSEQLIISAVSQLNREKAFFTNWQPSHLLLPNFSESIATVPEGDENDIVSKDDINKRKWAIDAGLQINWFIDDSTEIKAQLLHDINQVYQGFNVQLAVNKQVIISDKTRLNFGLGAYWQSAKLSDYYYGLDKNDQVALSHFYQASSGLNTSIYFGIHHQLSSTWQAQFLFKQEFLGQHITDSPLVNEHHITSAFVGVIYAF